MEVGQGLKRRTGAEPKRGLSEAEGKLPARSHAVGAGGRDRELERQPPPEEAGLGHTDHAASPTAAPAPAARAGTVAECVKAQDSAHAVSDQHHLIGESGALRRTDRRPAGRQALAASVSGTSPATDLPAEAGTLR